MNLSSQPSGTPPDEDPHIADKPSRLRTSRPADIPARVAASRRNPRKRPARSDGRHGAAGSAGVRIPAAPLQDQCMQGFGMAGRAHRVPVMCGFTALSQAGPAAGWGGGESWTAMRGMTGCWARSWPGPWTPLRRGAGMSTCWSASSAGGRCSRIGTAAGPRSCCASPRRRCWPTGSPSPWKWLPLAARPRDGEHTRGSACGGGLADPAARLPGVDHED